MNWLKQEMRKLNRLCEEGNTDEVYSYLHEHFATNHSEEQLRSMAAHFVDQKCQERRSKLYVIQGGKQ